MTDPSFLRVAWERVRTNRGARTSGVDGVTASYIFKVRGEDLFLADLRADLRAGRFVPLAVRERLIPKSGGRLRRLGIPTVDTIDHAALMDRVRRRVGDRRVLALVKAFLKSGLMTVDGAELGTITGTPQGGILTAPTQVRTSSSSGRSRGWREGVGREM